LDAYVFCYNEEDRLCHAGGTGFTVFRVVR
jgi:hypothetical protein